MSTRQESGFTITGRIDRKVHKVSDLREQVDDWDSLSDEEKHAVAQETEPAETDTVYNVTTDLLHQYFVDNLDPNNTSAESNVSPTWVGLGTDSASGTTTADTDLNNRTFEKEVTDHVDNGKSLLASTFLSSSDGNGNTFNEIGLFTGDPANLANADVFLVNHATFADVAKDNTETLTFDVTLTFADA